MFLGAGVYIDMTLPIPTTAIIGLEAYAVSVEADISPGLPFFTVVGLPDTAVQEARERVRSALKQSGLCFPRTRVAINMAPADLHKGGSGYDLPMAIALLVADRELQMPKTGWPVMVGELALDGSLRPVHGILSVALHVQSLQNKELIVPEQNAYEASLVPGICVRPARNLIEVLKHLSGEIELPQKQTIDLDVILGESKFNNFSNIKGQAHAKRALEIAAAGGHNILLTGPPGSGKTLLARAFPGILPRLTKDEALEVTRIYSVAGRLPHSGIVSTRPFRSPHHTASGAALVGGGTIPKPGEISLAHRGVLFLDEFPEFTRQVLENLRQPLEDGMVSVSRAQGTVCFPARFTLIAAMNPCPCGYAGDPERACVCTPLQALRYSKRISGPLFDRIDMCVVVPRVPTEDLVRIQPSEDSKQIRERVQLARDRQTARMEATGAYTNSELSSEHFGKLIPILPKAKDLMRRASDKFRLSARSYFRTLRVAQTIADLQGADTILDAHAAEALQYRQGME